MTKEDWALLVLQGKVAKNVDEAIEVAKEKIIDKYRRGDVSAAYWLCCGIPYQYLVGNIRGWEKIILTEDSESTDKTPAH